VPPVGAADLGAHCSSRAAAYKVPRHFVFRDELPRSPLGKVLRAAAAEQAARDYLAAPTTAGLADPLAFLTHEVCGLFGVAPHEVDTAAPLNSLGLNSIMAVQLKESLDRWSGSEVSLVELLGGASITQIAEGLWQPVTG
jgi:aryl carrier-like protein